MTLTATTARTTLLLTALAVIASGLWWLAEREMAALTPPSPPAPQIDGTAYQTFTRIYDRSGRLQQTLTAARLDHERLSAQLLLTQVTFESFRPPYHTVAFAQQARWLENEGRLDLWNTVRIRRDTLDAPPLALATEALTLWPHEGRGSSATQTWLLQGARWAVGDTLTAERDFTHIVLAGNAHVHWPAPPSPRQRVPQPNAPSARPGKGSG